MNARERLLAARADFAAKRVAREEFWRVSAECYAELRERTPLPKDGEIRAIRSEGDQLFVEMRNGLRFAWDPTDVRTAPNWILNHGAYERTEMAVLSELAEQSTAVFDVGANIGWYTLHLAKQVAPRNGHIHAFEPIPRTFATLERNVAANNLGSVVQLSPLGLGEVAGETTFYVPAATGSVAASQRQLIEAESNTRVTARISRLDDVVAELATERLDLLKCDIEGGELLMLRGGREAIRRLRPMLFLELLRKWSKAFGYHPNDVIDLLTEDGYRCWAITDSGLELMNRMDDGCVHTNFLFLHPDHDSVRAAVDARIASDR